MVELAEETEHAIKSVEWAERHHRKQPSSDEQQLRTLYRQSVLNAGVQLVDTPQLNTHHKVANYIQQNPFKCIAGIGVPAVALIFNGRNKKDHLSLQLKILHTRVFGQFAVICTLLGIMGLKEMMDRRCVLPFIIVHSNINPYDNSRETNILYLLQWTIHNRSRCRRAYQ